MALYAVDDDDLIDADHAEPGKTYWCLECFGPVKRRRGKSWFAHFYHLTASPKCRLYSKTEDHLLAQLFLQKLFAAGDVQIEKPFSTISRIADLCWEKEKIIFEIQCSPMTEEEAAARIKDYGSLGYHVVWLLDDKRYNKRCARPAEEFLRKKSAYYMAIKRGIGSEIYDQFEILVEGRRVKRGRRMSVDVRAARKMPTIAFDEHKFPKQITELQTSYYFKGDRLHRALQNHHLTMQNWRTLEIHLSKPTKAKTSKLKQWLYRHIALPYISLFNRLR